MLFLFWFILFLKAKPIINRIIQKKKQTLSESELRRVLWGLVEDGAANDGDFIYACRISWIFLARSITRFYYIYFYYCIIHTILKFLLRLEFIIWKGLALSVFINIAGFGNILLILNILMDIEKFHWKN